jgi:Tol biopolymer transport system component
MDTSFPNGSAETPDFTTEALFKLPPGCSPDAVTSDGHMVTFWAQPDGRVRFVWDDIAGEPFDGVPDMRDKLPAIFSSENGAHLAYAGERGDDMFIGDGAEEPSGEGFSRSVPPVFSPDGRHLAYGGYSGGEFRLIVDGEITGELPIAPIAAVFSPDGERLAFVEVREVAKDSFEQRIVLDGAPGPWFRGMRNARGAMQFSPDSRRFAYYRIDEEGHSQWIVDGVAQRLANEVRSIGLAQLRGIGILEDPLIASFSPDSRRFVYFADVLEKGVAILEDDVPGPLFKGVGMPVFSPDSRHLAYVGQTFSKQLTLVVDGTPGPEWPGERAGMPAFSADGRHVALTTYRKAGNILRKRSFYALVVDGNIVTELEGDDASLVPAFHPDGTRVAWWLQRGEIPQMMVNDTPHAEDSIAWGDPAFTSGGHLVYAAVVGEGSGTILIDGRPGPVADVFVDRQSTINVFGDPRTGKTTPVFAVSPDGEHVIWAGSFGEEHRPIIDDLVGPGFDRIIGSGFTSDGRATWWAQRRETIYRVSA